jgi:tRNA pseudouridine32 synthase/23S rRNA pseudouridine746 synthase/23S rRNA pseudouridine955/2504/2580 synthase
VAVDKPAGLLVIPGRGEGKGPSLRELLEQQLGQKLFVVHRLDRDTSGVLVFAHAPEAHRELCMAFEAGQVKKHYLALVRGQMRAPLQIDAPLVAARRGRMRAAHAGDDAKAAQTRVRPLEVFASATLVEAEPLTGRTHQIRVHLLHAGYPLLVDPQYGQPKSAIARDLGLAAEELVLSRTPLHAHRIELPARGGEAERSIEAPMPADIARTLSLLRGG